MSARAVFKRWPIATLLFCLHTLLILGVYVLWVTSSGDPERNMIWLFARLLDFPVAALEDIINPRYGLPAVFTCIVLGGMLWAFAGFLLDLLRRSISRNGSLRGTRYI